MVVDIQVKHAPSYRVASLIHYGPYAPNMFRTEFDQLVKWAQRHHLKTGKWIMRWIDEPNSKPASKMRSEASLEIRGKALTEGEIMIKKFPARTVAYVKFDPEQISARLVYSGIYGWLRYSDFEAADGPAREVYEGNPWSNRRAWSNAEVQVPVKKR